MTSQEAGDPRAGLLAKTLLSEAAEMLSKAGIEDPQREARYLLGLAVGKDGQALMHSAGRLNEQETNRLRELTKLRAQHVPFAYLAGRKEFWSLEFRVSPAVLIPRPDSEAVVELALALFKDRAPPASILDLGTGSGCLLLALLSEWPKARGTGVDISAEALAIATDNASRLGLSDRADFRLGDWGGSVDGPYDLILSNPPYVSESEWLAMAKESRLYEPRLALVAGTDGLSAYRALAAQAAGMLAPGAPAIVEAGAGQKDAIAAIFAKQNLTMTSDKTDLAGIDRALAFRALPASA